MYLSIFEFFGRFLADPAFRWAVILIFSVLLVNGWTDAPNAIACAVVTGALPFRRAALLAAACDLLGVLWAATFLPAVAYNLYSMAEFSAGPGVTMLALCAAFGSIVLWGIFAWLLGIPTSESHAMMAALSGAAVAVEGNLSCIRWESWRSVLWGLFLSVGLGFLGGKVVWRVFQKLPLSQSLCKGLQIPGAMAAAFLHGAQDGQKFLGVLLLTCSLASGGHSHAPFAVPLWMAAGCALFLSLGTALGGGRIIDTVGRKMVRPTPKEGVTCDGASGLCLLLATLWGLPVSTTHTRTAVLLGVGGKWDNRVVGSIAVTWLATFPGCFILGWGLTRLLL